MNAFKHVLAVLVFANAGFAFLNFARAVMFLSNGQFGSAAFVMTVAAVNITAVIVNWRFITEYMTGKRRMRKQDLMLSLNFIGSILSAASLVFSMAVGLPAWWIVVCFLIFLWNVSATVINFYRFFGQE